MNEIAKENISRSWAYVECVAALRRLQLPPPATDSDIADAEMALRMRLPPRLVDIYRHHDGSKPVGLFLSLKEAVAAYRDFRRQTRRGRNIKRVLEEDWSPDWLPIGFVEDVIVYAVDLTSSGDETFSVPRIAGLEERTSLSFELTTSLLVESNERLSNISPKEAAKLAWKAFDLRLAEACPGWLERLPKPATLGEVERLEKAIGRNLPQIVRDIYMIHNGVGMPSSLRGMASPRIMLSTEDVAVTWRERQALTAKVDTAVLPGEGVQSVWYHSGWIPISEDDAGNCRCLDLEPDEHGALGQIVNFWHDGPERSLLASSIVDYLVVHADVDAIAQVFSELD